MYTSTIMHASNWHQFSSSGLATSHCPWWWKQITTLISLLCTYVRTYVAEWTFASCMYVLYVRSNDVLYLVHLKHCKVGDYHCLGCHFAIKHRLVYHICGNVHETKFLQIASWTKIWRFYYGLPVAAPILLSFCTCRMASCYGNSINTYIYIYKQVFRVKWIVGLLPQRELLAVFSRKSGHDNMSCKWRRIQKG